MTAKSPEDIAGFEFDWLASDDAGQVALFSTAGGGYAPGEFLRDTERHDAAIKAILATKESTSARFAPELAPGLQNTWKLVAERGLFAFDSDPNGGPYNLVAAPAVPARISDLPEIAADVSRRIALGGLRFGSETVISEDAIQRSLKPSTA